MKALPNHNWDSFSYRSKLPICLKTGKKKLAYRTSLEVSVNVRVDFGSLSKYILNKYILGYFGRI